MLVIFHPDASTPEIDAVVARILATGAGAQRVVGAEQTVIGVIDADRDHIASLELDADPGVDRVVPVSSPYKLAHRHRHGDQAHAVEVAGVPFGGPDAAFRLILGPCAVESSEQMTAAADACLAAGADLLRGGAFKPRTSPYAFQGLGLDGLKILAEARDRTGLPIVTELTDLRDIDAVLEYADCIQVGARNMQHFPLLTEIGRAGLPVLLKRGMGASVDDFLLAAEYILTEGNPHVVLCERGIHANATPAR
ncbi:MAG TPA: 3-deoxy-7-phosphoheptulonate synthase, partial [Baekduia sp.]|nr:3-deoxy-7-phosphoheptulonate synthase [Baekduia sp.]